MVKINLKKIFTSKKKGGVKKERRTTAKRAAGATRLLEAIGVARGGVRAGAGRPKGTYKYNMPIQQYKKLQSRKKTLRNVYQQEQLAKLQRRGLTPEQINQLQYINAIQQQRVIPAEMVSTEKLETPESVMSVADEELAFTKFRADKTIHPNTQRLLRNLRRIQLKGAKDDTEMQRRLKERKMISDASNILRTKNMFGPDSAKFNILDMENNILTSPNIFASREDNKIMRTNRPNILQTKEVGNNLHF